MSSPITLSEIRTLPTPTYSPRVTPPEGLVTKFGLYKNPIGIEIELEGVDLDKFPDGIVWWTTTSDNSLKNHGVEVVSRPLSGKHIDYALLEYEKILSSQKKVVLSHRCSTHVHLNVLDLTPRQVDVLIAAYACLERLFFGMCEGHRIGNTFCSPLTDFTPFQDYLLNPSMGMKYCALNTYPIMGSYGTVEFRHLHATKSIQHLTRWLQMICKLYNAVINNEELLAEQIKNLNSVSNYFPFVQGIFSPIVEIYLKNKDLQIEMEEGVSWAKSYLAFTEFLNRNHYIIKTTKLIDIPQEYKYIETLLKNQNETKPLPHMYEFILRSGEKVVSTIETFESEYNTINYNTTEVFLRMFLFGGNCRAPFSAKTKLNQLQVL